MWTADELAASGTLRWVSTAQGRLLNDAAICITVWALLASYGVRRNLRDIKARQDSCDETWALFYARDEAAARRARIHPLRQHRR